MKTNHPKTRKRSRITSIQVSRLYNTGNYTNISYSLTAEVPKGGSALETLKQLYYVIQMLKPLRKPECLDRFKTASAKMEGEQSEYEKEHLPEWREEIVNFEALKAAREAAVKSLDDLGGSSQRRDAKRDWEDDNDTPF